MLLTSYPLSFPVRDSFWLSGLCPFVPRKLFRELHGSSDIIISNIISAVEDFLALNTARG